MVCGYYRIDPKKGEGNMGKTYVVANRKGGCSKTTTVGALGSGLSRLGYKVLVIDMDPQGNISDWAGIDTEEMPTIYQVLRREVSTTSAIQKAKYYDIIPADESLSSIEADLQNTPGKELRLKECLDEVRDGYDFILVDTPPNLGYLSVCSFAAADGGIIVTSDASAFASKGMSRLVDHIELAKKYYNREARVAGILLTRVNPQTNVFQTMRELTKQFGEFFDAPVYDTFIRQTTVVMNAQMTATDLYDMMKINAAAQDYKAFVDEFLVKEGYKEADETAAPVE